MNKITPENYERYCELYKSKFTNEGQKEKYLVGIFKSGIIPLILFILSVFFASAGLIPTLATINFFVVPPVVLIKTVLNDIKKTKLELARKYPNIDINLTLSQIENMLEESKILSYECIDGQYCSKLDIDGYKNYIECEKVKNSIIEESKILPIETDFNIADNELEKVKLKIKTKSKRLR